MYWYLSTKAIFLSFFGCPPSLSINVLYGLSMRDDSPPWCRNCDGISDFSEIDWSESNDAVELSKLLESNRQIVTPGDGYLSQASYSNHTLTLVYAFQKVESALVFGLKILTFITPKDGKPLGCDILRTRQASICIAKGLLRKTVDKATMKAVYPGKVITN